MLVPKRRRGLLVFLLFLMFAVWGDNLWNPPDNNEIFNSFDPSDNAVIMTSQAQKHILYGDERGGGHKFGVGNPCKSEFPEDWDNEEILSIVKTMAANDNANWKEQNNGYHTSEQRYGDIRIRVVLNRDMDRIVTAYPVNVARNPCPSPANDNDPQ